MKMDGAGGGEDSTEHLDDILEHDSKVLTGTIIGYKS